MQRDADSDARTTPPNDAVSTDATSTDRHGGAVANMRPVVEPGAAVTERSARRMPGAQQSGRMAAMEPMVALVEHGMLLESARGPIPNVAEMVAGEPIRGSWWSHPSSHAIFDVLNVLADSPDVVRTRLVNGKVTLIHRRLWPALARLADRLPVERLAAIHEEHTASGAHRKREQPFPEWVPEDVELAAKHLSEAEAVSQLPTSVAAILIRSKPSSDHP